MTDSSASLDQWLERLMHQHHAAIDLGLERVAEVARRLGLLDQPLAPRVISVAGTNGKGSTVAMIDACAQACGLSSVCYTSPHLLRYNERVRVNGLEASDAELVAAFERIERARLAEPAVSLSYFETGTLAAALIIRQQSPDIAILEVGLGGRLDAVNIFDADVAVVTTIALDHADYLGTDISVIGREKAGIMRAGGAAVLGSRTLPDSVAEYAEQLGVRVVAALGTTFDYHTSSGQFDWHGIAAKGQPLRLEQLAQPQLPLDNAASALQALVLAGIEPDQAQVSQAFEALTLAGRMQRIGRWCLDVAHNPHAAGWVARKLANGPVPQGRIALLAMLGDKDANSVVSELAPVIDGWVCATIEGDRGRSAASLAERVIAGGGQVMFEAHSVADALVWIDKNEALADWEVLVCGSFVTVAAALEWLNKRSQGVDG
ncbi:Dihydrofolate synthase/folylpolyglutamate synthase [Carnimonas sp. R-84981]|uniref:bifunctional tetrahydrofolate synthase/dihydrofolate synthase n=1 Tax=Carnimonas bestiolae TaxID=3402172 RepID=UPI003EDCA09B